VRVRHRPRAEDRGHAGVHARREVDRERRRAGRPDGGELRRVDDRAQHAGSLVEGADRRGVVRQPPRDVAAEQADVLDHERQPRPVAGHHEQPAVTQLDLRPRRRRELTARGSRERRGQRLEERGRIEQRGHVLRAQEEDLAVHAGAAHRRSSCPAYGPRPVMFAAPQRAPSRTASAISSPAARPVVSPAANESPAP
jgi:hypothetical protein